jgi:hypothetical protein
LPIKSIYKSDGSDINLFFILTYIKFLEAVDEFIRQEENTQLGYLQSFDEFKRNSPVLFDFYLDVGQSLGHIVFGNVICSLSPRLR